MRKYTIGPLSYSILSHAECSVHSRTSKTVRTCYCDLTAIIYLIPAGRLIPLVVTSFPVLSFHNSTFKRLIPSYLAKELPCRTRTFTRPNSNEGTTSNDFGPKWSKQAIGQSKDFSKIVNGQFKLNFELALTHNLIGPNPNN